ncbi:hypothetical protein PsYK624_035390 [Phanerochaete sordida]|uniref:F-box domain-containing protein n=1 Tax=Phanerochaete sordida TaxID=48140 RepID=A0A9P3G389_9APHY|nr:hypothetical protein PsYK624_035390 [Phanerochaete sordida]
MTATNSLPTLPQELVDMVIDYLHKDTKALVSCSLVARSWAPSSHYHLFYEIQLGRADTKEGSQFLQLLEKSISLRESVRVVLLWGASICVCPDALLSLLNSFPNLHSLRMYGVTCKYTPGKFVQWTRARKLRRLELSGFEALRGEIVNTMAFFSRVPVDELLLGDWEVLPISLHQALREILPCDSMEEHLHSWEVASLSFMDNVPPVALEIARPAIAPQSLRSLNASEQTAWAMPQSFAALLADVGPYLTHLRLDLTGIYTRSSEDLGRSLTRCTSLRSLHLFVSADVFYDRFASVTVATAAFPDCLLQYAPPTLRTVTLGFGIDYDGSFVKYWADIVNWAQLEEQLLSFRALHTVRFVMEMPCPAIFTEPRLEPMADGQRDLIIKSLPKLHAAGKVLV